MTVANYCSNIIFLLNQIFLFRCVDKWLNARRDFVLRTCDGGGDAETDVEEHMNSNVLALIPNIRRGDEISSFSSNIFIFNINFFSDFP